MGTVSVEKSEVLSSLLKRRGIRHEVLNAKFHEKEAPIVAQAGRSGAVTIATNMAGRGTDIKLGGDPAGLASQKLHNQGLNPAEVEPEVYEEALAEADAECDEDHDRGRGRRRPAHHRHGAPRRPPHRQPAARSLPAARATPARRASSSRSRTRS